MNDLVLNSLTKRQLMIFLANPTHALLLTGPQGSGKRAVAIHLAEQLLGTKTGGFANYPYGRLIEPEKALSIGVEAIRELEHFLSLKVPGKMSNNRLIIVDGGELLTLEAQNALLKTLEEPPTGTFLIITAVSDQQLLPTIRSRTQIIQLHAPTKTDLEAYFMKASPADFKRAYAISGGLPGLMHALLNNEDHPLLSATDIARQLLNESSFERLSRVDDLAKQRQLAIDMTFILQQMAHTSLQTASGLIAVKWQIVLAASYRANEALTASAQPKLALTDLMLHL